MDEEETNQEENIIQVPGDRNPRVGYERSFRQVDVATRFLLPWSLQEMFGSLEQSRQGRNIKYIAMP